MSDVKIKIKFLENVVVDDCYKGTRNETAFKAGKTYDLPERSANRWLIRGKATILNSKAPKDESAGEKTGG